MKGRLCNMAYLDLWPQGITSLANRNTHTKFSWDHVRGLWDIEDFSLWPCPPVTLTFDHYGENAWAKPNTPAKFWLKLDQGSPRYSRFFNMTLTSVTLTFDPIGSILGPSLINTPSLVEIGPGVLEILKIFNMTLTPVTLTFDPMGSLLGPSLIHTPSLDESEPRILDILKIFQYDLDPSDLDLWPRGVPSWPKPNTYTKFGWNWAKGLGDTELWPLTPVTLTFKK